MTHHVMPIGEREQFHSFFLKMKPSGEDQQVKRVSIALALHSKPNPTTHFLSSLALRPYVSSP
jgi:hypothetical protein